MVRKVKQTQELTGATKSDLEVDLTRLALGDRVATIRSLMAQMSDLERPQQRVYITTLPACNSVA